MKKGRVKQLVILFLLLATLGVIGGFILYRTSPHVLPVVWKKPYTLKDFDADTTNSKITKELEKVLVGMNQIRIQTKKRYRINSGYRNKEKNKKVGGAKNSQHLYGRALDVFVTQKDRVKFYEAAKSAGFTGFGWGNNIVHIDMGPKRWWTYDNNGKEAKGNKCKYISKAPANFIEDYKACK